MFDDVACYLKQNRINVRLVPDQIPAAVLCREVRERGYHGGETCATIRVGRRSQALARQAPPGAAIIAFWSRSGRPSDREA
jgi:hypothetical protein